MSDLLKQASNFLTPEIWHKGCYAETYLNGRHPRFCVLGAIGAAARWGSPAGVPQFNDEPDPEGDLEDVITQFFDGHKEQDGEDTASAELYALSEAIHQQQWCKVTKHPQARCNHGDHPEEWVENLITCIAYFNDSPDTTLEQVQQVAVRAQEILDEQAP